MGKALEWLGGSVLIYTVVAACGGGGNADKHVADVDSGASSGGMMGAGGTAQDSGPGDVVTDVLDAMVDPVPDADAAPMTPGPTVTTVPCSSTLQVGPSNQDVAELEIPGRSAASLAGTFAMINTEHVEGYPAYSTLVAIREGGVAAVCGTDETLTVTFVVPPA